MMGDRLAEEREGKKEESGRERTRVGETGEQGRE